MDKELYHDLYTTENTHWWSVSKQNLVKKIIQQQFPSKKLNILDLGCGTGKMLEVLGTLGVVWGVDSSSEALKFCKERGLKNLKLAEAHQTGFASNQFDIVTCLDILEHTDDREVLKEANRILKSGGILIATVPAYQYLWSKWDEKLGHKRRYNKTDLSKILKEASFDISLLSYLYSFLVLPVILVRSIKSLFYKNSYSSDFSLINPILNGLLLGVAGIERHSVLQGRVPFGTSLVAVATKP